MDKYSLVQRMKDKIELRESQYAQPGPPARAREYQYSPLNEAAQEIRLLKLLPGKHSSGVRVCLETTSLTDHFVPDFDAVSYAWGSQDNPVNIFIREEGVDSTLAVTQNLAEALPYLRHRFESRMLWIDAICVNQQDAEERSSQVQRMADIYSQAQTVLVWLGPESHDSSLALECVRKVSSKVEVDWGLQIVTPISDELHWANLDAKLPFSAEEFLAIANLFHRSWFKRLWIWQEVCLAKRAVVICGTESHDWKDIQTMVFCLHMKDVSELFHQHCGYHHRLLLYDLCKFSGSYIFVELLDFTKSSLCSDPSDRIFALLSLLPEWEGNLKIVPDYTKATLQVYHEITVRYIKDFKKLNILTAVHSEELSVGGESWIPDWSVPRITTPLPNVFAGGLSMSMATFSGKEEMILEVHGLIVSTVESSEPFALSESTSYRDFVTELQRVAKEFNLKQYIDDNPQNLKDLCRVLSSNQFSSQYSPPFPGYPTLDQTESFLGNLLAFSSENHESSEFLSPADVMVLSSPLRCCDGRSLFRSKDGHVGIGPKRIQTGDLITVWLGCDSAMILRPTRAGQYLLMGEAYCSKVMDGAAFMGSLPDNIEMISRYDEQEKSHVRIFVDRRSGEALVEDPRLAGIPLPPGWRGQESEDQDYLNLTYYVNDETGEDNGPYDPRLTCEGLKSRGVKMELFEIV